MQQASVTPRQSRAARALLGWTQADLAKAATIGLSTVKNYEGELRETTPANLHAIIHALEDAGAVFESDGKFVGVKVKKRRAK
jgi:transcriptional regulator with XRE-family HTH domain